MDQLERTELGDVPITAGEVHLDTVPFDGSAVGSGTPLELSGSFTGGGQRSDVDALLRYARPADRSTDLAPGTTQVVELPMEPGRNVLLLLVDGAVGGRTATDRDRLTLRVP